MTPALVRRTASEAETEALGAALLPALRPGDVVFLEADLGVGKSAMARGAVRASMGADIDVPSPTFGFVQPYDGAPPLLHVDLYRLEEAEDVAELGLEDAEACVLLVEWPDRAEPFLPMADLVVRGTIIEGEDRQWSLTATPDMADRLRRAGLT